MAVACGAYQGVVAGPLGVAVVGSSEAGQASGAAASSEEGGLIAWIAEGERRPSLEE